MMESLNCKPNENRNFQEDTKKGGTQTMNILEKLDQVGQLAYKHDERQTLATGNTLLNSNKVQNSIVNYLLFFFIRYILPYLEIRHLYQ